MSEVDVDRRRMTDAEWFRVIGISKLSIYKEAHLEVFKDPWNIQTYTLYMRLPHNSVVVIYQLAPNSYGLSDSLDLAYMSWPIATNPPSDSGQWLNDVTTMNTGVFCAASFEVDIFRLIALIRSRLSTIPEGTMLHIETTNVWLDVLIIELQ
jgi:hypothetical protein